MKTQLLIIAFLTCLFGLANNVNVRSLTVDGAPYQNPRLTNQNTGTHITNVRCDITWENSWRTGSAPNNWDAVWVFVKYKLSTDASGAAWKHATLSTTPSNYSVSGVDGNNNGVAPTFAPASDGKGLFIYRAGNGTGNIDWRGLLLQWNYGTDGVADNASVKFQVFAIEMVWIPTGSFYIGDGGAQAGKFVQTQITTSDATAMGGYATGVNGVASIGKPDASGAMDGSVSNPDWPNGYLGYYIMKYEMSQSQYVDFLNTLTYYQQWTNICKGNGWAPSNSAGTRVMWNPGAGSSYRNYVRVKTSGVNNTTPAVFGVDYNGDGTYGDGGDIPLNNINWSPALAYTDWACLRPMTEYEYEKAAKGPNVPVTNSYAWGTTAIYAGVFDNGAGGIQNAGQSNELPWAYSSTANANCFSNTFNGGSPSTSYLIQGPLRCGSFAAVTTGGANDRPISGGSYYGVMELSGNLEEMVVTIYSTASNGAGFPFYYGQKIKYYHNGDGTLYDYNDSGNDGKYVDPSFNYPWPNGTSGWGYRGGDWYYPNYLCVTSDRSNCEINTAPGFADPVNGGGPWLGFRAVRTY